MAKRLTSVAPAKVLGAKVFASKKIPNLNKPLNKFRKSNLTRKTPKINQALMP